MLVTIITRSSFLFVVLPYYYFLFRCKTLLILSIPLLRAIILIAPPFRMSKEV